MGKKGIRRRTKRRTRQVGRDTGRKQWRKKMICTSSLHKVDCFHSNDPGKIHGEAPPGLAANAPLLHPLHYAVIAFKPYPEPILRKKSP